MERPLSGGLFGRLFVGAPAGELASLCSQRDGRSNENEGERRAQASRRYAVDTGADDCRCFVHGATFPDDPASPLDRPGSAGVNRLSFVRENKLTRFRTASVPKGVQGVGNEDADAQYNNKSDDGPKHNSFLHERLQ
jgi:hypothetical protein